MPSKIGIIAGSGELPRVLVEACRRDKRPFVLVALAGHADMGEIGHGVPHLRYRMGKAGTIIEALRRQQVRELVFAGAVPRPSLIEWLPDWRTLRFILGRRIWWIGDGGVLNAMIHTLEDDEGFRIVGPETVEPDLLAHAGPVGRLAPDAEAERDIAVGWREARGHGARDLGQGVVAGGGAVIDREDKSGTDALLRRCRDKAGADTRHGVLVKLARPFQDRRVDLPVVGVKTVRGAAAAGLAGIAVEAGGALVVDRAKVAAAADEAGIFVVGVAPA